MPLPGVPPRAAGRWLNHSRHVTLQIVRWGFAFYYRSRCRQGTPAVCSLHPIWLQSSVYRSIENVLSAVHSFHASHCYIAPLRRCEFTANASCRDPASNPTLILMNLCTACKPKLLQHSLHLRACVHVVSGCDCECQHSLISFPSQCVATQMRAVRYIAILILVPVLYLIKTKRIQSSSSIDMSSPRTRPCCRECATSRQMKGRPNAATKVAGAPRSRIWVSARRHDILYSSAYENHSGFLAKIRCLACDPSL